MIRFKKGGRRGRADSDREDQADPRAASGPVRSWPLRSWKRPTRTRTAGSRPTEAAKAAERFVREPTRRKKARSTWAALREAINRRTRTASGH